MKTTYEPGTPRVEGRYSIKITAAGPYMVFGGPEIRTQTIELNAKGAPWSFLVGQVDYAGGREGQPVALCRCGQSKNAPYCDASHQKAAWDPTLAALPDDEPLRDAEQYEGPTLTLTDAEKLCAFARFCDAKGRTWNQNEQSDDPIERNLAIRTSGNCPSGRLKVWDNETGEPIEPTYPASIGLIEDPAIATSGPIWVRGGIPIVAPDGRTYTVRNRVTLCRCGNSANKPFCDGTHASSHYRDRIKTKQ